MAYELYDGNGFVAGGPTIRGLETLRLWVGRYDWPVAQAFLDTGETTNLSGLIAELQSSVPLDADTNAMRLALIDAAKHAQDILILTDGDF